MRMQQAWATTHSFELSQITLSGLGRKRKTKTICSTELTRPLKALYIHGDTDCRTTTKRKALPHYWNTRVKLVQSIEPATGHREPTWIKSSQLSTLPVVLLKSVTFVVEKSGRQIYIQWSVLRNESRNAGNNLHPAAILASISTRPSGGIKSLMGVLSVMFTFIPYESWVHLQEFRISGIRAQLIIS